MLATTGCISHTRTVQAVHAPPVVMDATVEDLVQKLNANFEGFQSLNVTANFNVSTGGGATGKITDYTSFKGYILIQKPRNLRVIGLLPLVGTRMIDMVSKGPTFTLLIPSRSEAITGSDQVLVPSKEPLKNLRPGTFFDSLLIKDIDPEDFVTLTESSRIVQPESRKHDAIEEPDYDLTVLRKKSGNILNRKRVIHFNRVTLLPYEQDIYDDRGRISTLVTYNAYQKFGEIQFPTEIGIDRPVDLYSLKLSITKVTPNQKMEADEFELPIPEGYKVQNMDEPGAIVKTAPSVPHASQSQR